MRLMLMMMSCTIYRLVGKCTVWMRDVFRAGGNLNLELKLTDANQRTVDVSVLMSLGRTLNVQGMSRPYFSTFELRSV